MPARVMLVRGPVGKSKPYPAKGTCTYGNFAAGQKTIRCLAKTKDGRSFEGVFEMSGPPQL